MRATRQGIARAVERSQFSPPVEPVRRTRTPCGPSSSGLVDFSTLPVPECPTGRSACVAHCRRGIQRADRRTALHLRTNRREPRHQYPQQARHGLPCPKSPAGLRVWRQPRKFDLVAPDRDPRRPGHHQCRHRRTKYPDRLADRRHDPPLGFTLPTMTRWLLARRAITPVARYRSQHDRSRSDKEVIPGRARAMWSIRRRCYACRAMSVWGRPASAVTSLPTPRPQVPEQLQARSSSCVRLECTGVPTGTTAAGSAGASPCAQAVSVGPVFPAAA